MGEKLNLFRDEFEVLYKVIIQLVRGRMILNCFEFQDHHRLIQWWLFLSVLFFAKQNGSSKCKQTTGLRGCRYYDFVEWNAIHTLIHQLINRFIGFLVGSCSHWFFLCNIHFSFVFGLKWDYNFCYSLFFVSFVLYLYVELILIIIINVV